jgi:XTP/dITP diphosphohydrolase
MLNVATGNPDKVQEFQNVLGDVELRSLKDFPELAEPVEDGDSLEENALIKARALFNHCGELSIADDTGLMVDALNGEPGVFSARWAGEDCSYSDNVQKMIREIADVPKDKRQARFETVIAIVGPDGLEALIKGVCRGVILDEARGQGGFGYDPVFYVAEFDKTFAEMTMDEKSQVSHRGKAVRALKSWLEQEGLLG